MLKKLWELDCIGNSFFQLYCSLKLDHFRRLTLMLYFFLIMVLKLCDLCTTNMQNLEILLSKFEDLPLTLPSPPVGGRG